MRGWLDKIKNLVVYDADKEFYAQVFPGSVERNDLLRLRRMGAYDLPRVVEIEKKGYQFPWSEDIFRDCFRARYDCWVCEDNGHIVGYVIVSIAVGEAHVLNVCVDTDEQGQGIGRKILEMVLDMIKGRAETVFLEVRPSNPVALALYRSMGFNEIGIRKGYYPAANGREDAIMLALELI